MKRLLILLATAVISICVYAQIEPTRTATHSGRYEMTSITYGLSAYNIRFDKWTGNMWIFSKDKQIFGVRDKEDSESEQRGQCVYQFMKGYNDVVERCFVLNTATGEIWEVSIKNDTIKYKKL